MFEFFAKITRQLARNWLQEKYPTHADGPQQIYTYLLAKCQTEYGEHWATKHVSSRFFNFIRIEIQTYKMLRMQQLIQCAKTVYQEETNRLEEDAKILAMTDNELLEYWINAGPNELEILSRGMEP